MELEGILMHRMRRFTTLFGLVTTSLLWQIAPAGASLLNPNAGRAYPDIAADINGVVTYSYDSSSQTGLFHVSNTPYLIATGPTSSEEFDINPNSNTGVRSQQISITLDKSGNLMPSTQNMYALYGTVNVNGQTFSGTLLQGTPTAFGSQTLTASGITASSVFDVNLAITGGVLAPYFGSTAYMRISPELASTFTGAFDTNFSALKATSNTRSYNSPLPFAVPEPSTWIVVTMGLGGLALRGRSRRKAS
jgi:hypothetical protein